MRLFSKPNLVELKATPITEPWKLKPFAYPPGLVKEQIQAMWKDPSFKHHFFSAFEGMTESVFVSKEAKNRPFRQWCLIVDYDARLSDTMREHVKNNPPVEYPPSWLVTTVSGNARLIWDFELPVMFSNDQQALAFLNQITRRLQLSRWLPGLDLKCLRGLYQCCELGQKWEPLTPEAKIPIAVLNSWLLDASKTVTLLSPEDHKTNIPLTHIAEEVVKRFPGRWQGEFDLGRRGIRFWDPVADNPTAAVVTPEGMMCFTGDKPFMTWKAIFGPRFVEEYEAAKADIIMRRALWDEKCFWLQLGDENWERFTAEHFSRWLKCEGMSSKPEFSGGASEIDKMMILIQTHCRVRAALPFVFQPQGPMTFRGERILNISRVKVLQPADAGIFHDFDSAVKTFPFIWSFLTNFLERVDKRPVQLTYLLHWMKHVYETGYYMRPRPGHAIVLAGTMSKGKTFFATALLGKMLGGSGDSSDFVVKGSQWTNQLAKWPIALIDDQQGGANHEAHTQFSAVVKKLVANRSMSYNGKYESTGEVEWLGRVIINCNDDAESLRLLPTMDNSIADKISLLRVNGASDFVFPADESETSRHLEEELPYFCRFLLDMKYEEDAKNAVSTRFFLKPFHHPFLMGHACRGGMSYSVYELLQPFLQAYKKEKPDDPIWQGTASQLYQCLYAEGRETMNRLNPRTVGIALGQMQAQGMKMTASAKHGGLQVWHIPCDLEWGGTDFPKSGSAVSAFLDSQTTPQGETQQ